MSSTPEPESPRDNAPGPDSAGPPASAAPIGVLSAGLWAWAVGAGVAAGIAAWLVCEQLLVVYHDDLTRNVGAFPPPEVTYARIAAEKHVATLSFTALGGLLGLALGVAGGGARRSALAAGGAGLA